MEFSFQPTETAEEWLALLLLIFEVPGLYLCWRPAILTENFPQFLQENDGIVP
jgi:hypothetical protein